LEFKLETERTLLSPFQIGEEELFQRLSSDSFIRRYLWDDENISLDLSKEIMAKNAAHFRTKKFGIWKVIHKKKNQIVGYAGLWYFFSEKQPQLIYALLEAYTKRGLATEIAQKIMRYSFDHLEFEYLIASMDEAHLTSQKVAERIGMQKVEKRVINGQPTLFYKASAKNVN